MRLFWRIYLAVLGSLIVFAIAAAALWHLGGGPPNEHARALARIVQNALPPAEAPPHEQQAALEHLTRGLRFSLTLLDADRRLIAAVGPPLIPPGAPAAESLHHAPETIAWSARLPDGRWLLGNVAIGPHSLGAVLVLLVLLAAAVALCALPIVRHLTRRLERLQRGAEALGGGNLGARVDVEGNDEVARLAQSFNDAAARIEHLVGAHKTLLAQASHELRTPLTRIRLALDLLKRDIDPRHKAGLETDVAELDHLVSEILLASRLDAMPELEQTEDVDLLALAAEEAARYEATEVDGDHVHVRGDPRLLRRLVRNLLENARRHGRPPVQVSLRSSTDTIELIVADAGEPIAEAERTRLFEPFYRRGNTDGHGLGLALVRQIARRHGGDAQYDAIAADRAGFIVTLPHSRSASSQQ
jgi:signal transduction histidine kinase